MIVSDPLIRGFLGYIRVEGGLSAATLEAYRRDLQDLNIWIKENTPSSLQSISFQDLATHLRTLKTERKLESTSVARHLASIRIFFRWMEATSNRDDNPARLLETPTRWQRLPEVLTPKQMDLLLNSPRDHGGPLALRDIALLEVLYSSGLRATEICLIGMDEFNSTLGVLIIHGKGSKDRIVPVGEPAIEAIKDYKKNLRVQLDRRDGKSKSRLFLSRTGKPLHRVAIWQIVQRHARAAGLRDVHPHILRHSFATHLLHGGADLRVVQELLGHSNIQTTQVYTHVDRSSLAKVVKGHHPRP